MPQNQQNPYGFDYDPDWRNRETTDETDRGFVDPNTVPPTTRPAEDFAGTYGFEYQPNWREEELVAPDEYGWGIVNAFKRGFERLRAMPDVAQGDYEELAQHFGNIEQYRMSDEDMAKFEELRNTEGFWAKLGGVLQEPRLIGQVVAESLPMMAAPIVGALGGGLAGGSMAGPAGAVGGGMVGGGLGSFMTEYYASVADGMQEAGVDMTNPAQLKAAFNDPQVMQLIEKHAKKRSIPIAVFDALSMGLAGRIARPARTLTGKIAGQVGEIGMQAGLGAAGEAGAQLYSEGEITDELDVILEGVAEIAPGFVEAGVSSLTRKRAGIPDPNDSPLAALDQPDEGDGPGGGRTTPIPETDIDMRTGRVVTRTGDAEYDALDRALEQASVELELDIEMASQAKELATAAAERAAQIQGSRNMRMIEMEQERDAQLQKQGRLEEARKAAQEDQMWQEQATAGIEDVGAAEGEMVTPRGVPIEGEPIDVAGAQPAEEGMIRPEGVVPPGGRPFGVSLGEALREAGVRPPERPQEPPAGPTTPERGPDVTAKEAAASEALMREEEQRALDEEAEAGYPDIPFTDEEIAARRPPDDEGPEGPPPPPASMAVEKPKPEPVITEAVAKPNVPKPTKRPNYARDNFLTTRAKETVDKRLSMEKFEAEGLDIADMREKVYGGKPAFSRHPNAMGPDDVAEFLNENNYPNPFDNGSTGTWDANQALEAIRDEMAGVSDILTGEAIGNRAEEARYEEDLLEYQRQEEEAAPAGGEQLDMMPEPTGRDAQVTRDQRQREREGAAPEADMGVAGDLFTGTSAESRQAAEMEAAQTDIEEAAKEGEVIPAQQYPVVQIMEDKDGVTVSFGGYERTYANLDRIAAEAQFREDFADVLGTPEGRAAAGGVPAEELDTGGVTIEGELLEAARIALEEDRDGDPKIVTMQMSRMERLAADLGVEPKGEEESRLDFVRRIQKKARAIVAGEDVEETQGARWEREEFEQRQRQLRNTGDMEPPGRTVEGVAAEVEGNLTTMKGPYDRTFGHMGRPRLVTAFRQLKANGYDPELYQELLDRVTRNLTYAPTRNAFLEAIDRTPESNILVADIERQHEEWRQEVIETDWMKLDQNEINQNNARIDELAAMGDERAIELVQEADHWMNKDRISAKSSHPRFKQSRKSNKYGGITDIRSRNSISLDAAQLSATVDYDSLTFKSPEDQARIDRILEVIEKVKEPAAKPEPEAGPTPPPAPPGEFVLNEQRFEEEGPDTEARVFSAIPPIDVKKRVAIDTKLKREGNKFLTPDQAEDRLIEWEKNAMSQGSMSSFFGASEDTGPQNHKDNYNRVIISLFDTTGQWANPYALAGYDVRTMDIKDGIDVTDFSVQFLEDTFGSFEGKEIYGILAACPCTTFSNSSTKWRRSDLPPDHPQNRHENADPEYSRKWIEEMWGKKAAEAKDENGDWLYATPHDYAIALVHKTIQTLEYFRPQFWAVENPEGRIEESAGLPNPWRTGFQPHNFGDPYTKRTLLWGNFNDDLPTANVEPTEGSKMHMLSPTEDRAARRSETPEGFALAFFQANNYLDTDPRERTMKDYWYVAGAIDEAFRAGVTEDQIRERVYLDQAYEPESDSVEGAKEELRKLIDEAQGGTPPPTTPTPTTPTPEGPPPAPPAAPATESKRFMISGSVMSSTRDGLMSGITKTRMDRIAENFAKVGDQLLSNVTTSDRKFIKPDPFTEINFSEYDDYIRINSVNLSGLGTANTTRPDVYDSRKPTHIKKALIALDQKLQSLVKYQEQTPSALDIARAEAETNIEPTKDQQRAGNYKKGRVPLPLGMEFHIETPEGEVRYGKQKLRDPYGGFTGTKGMDGDPVDGFLNKKIEKDWRGDVYIIDQVNPETKKFDEHKVMFGYNNAMDARRAYKRNYQKDWKGTGNVTIMPIETFKQWLDTPGATKKPAAEFGTTEAAKKAREKSNKDNLYASGKDMLNAPNIEFVKAVLEGGEKKMGDIVDTMPLNMAVEELLRIREQPAGFQAPEAPAYMPDSEEIEAAIKPLEDRMPGAPVRLLFDYRQAPEIVQRGMEADNMTHVPAVYSPVTNEIYLFTTRIDSTEHAVQLALHEKTHQGLREAFGTELDTILENVYENASPKDVEFMMDLSERYNKNMNILEDQLVLAEELIAYKAETDPQNNLVQRVVAFIKKWLRKAGLRLEYSDADITAIIAEAQNAIARRDSYGNVMLTEDVEVAETGEVYEVEVPAKDALDAVDKRLAMCEKVKKCL